MTADPQKDLERTLMKAARKHLRPWWRQRSAGIALLVLLGVAAPATAATGLWSPPVGDDNRGRPTISATGVPNEQRETLEVLRRPQNVTDRSPEVRKALTFLDSKFEGLRTRDVRVLSPGGPHRGVILIPAQRVKSGKIDDALCLYGIDTEGGGVSCWNIDQVRAGEASLITIEEGPEQQRRHEAAVRECARRAPNNGRGGFSCQTPSGASTTVYDGLVPDDIATVTASAGTTSSTAKVNGNYFHLKIDAAAAPTLRFRDENGKDILPIQQSPTPATPTGDGQP